jgi:anti-anti-sigma regulatory factor
MVKYNNMSKQKFTRINIAEKIASILSSRDAIRNLDEPIQKAKTDLVKLDFVEIDFVSRSAAHELLLLKEKFDRQSKSIFFINANQDVSKMLRIVAANRALPLQKSTEFNVPIVNIKSLIGA